MEFKDHEDYVKNGYLRVHPATDKEIEIIKAETIAHFHSNGCGEWSFYTCNRCDRSITDFSPLMLIARIEQLKAQIQSERN